MTEIYYVETNTICIIVMLLLLSQLRLMHGQSSTERQVFKLELLATVILCIADMLSSVLRGHTFYGAWLLNGVGNVIYILMVTAIGYLWTLYINVKLGKMTRRRMLLWAIPLLCVVAIAATNPWTDVLFTLGEDNLYVRGEGIFLQWIVSWLYMLVPTFQIVHAIIHEKNRNRRQELRIYLYFIIAPTVAGVFQMLFYGVTCIQVGVTISFLVVFLLGQNTQILTDTLTGLNNRRGLDNFTDERIRRQDDAGLFFLMIDIDNFKMINDKLGHIVGDRALEDAADALKAVCAATTENLFLCRYGGDEFLIAGDAADPEYTARLCEQIRAAFAKRNALGDKPYTLTPSIGVAAGRCANQDDVEHLLRVSDEAMYEDKKSSKR